jgi:hypothetical protein
MADGREAAFGGGWYLISPVLVKTFQSSNWAYWLSGFPVSYRRISASISLFNYQIPPSFV